MKKWRKMALYGAFSRGKSAILRCSWPAVPDCNTLVCRTLRSRSLAASRGVLGAKSAVRRHFSRSGHEITYAQQDRLDDCADFAGDLGRPARS